MIIHQNSFGKFSSINLLKSMTGFIFNNKNNYKKNELIMWLTMNGANEKFN